MQVVYVFRPVCDVSSLVSYQTTVLAGSWPFAQGAVADPSLCYIDSCR
jgi:hypothetical protein